MHLAASLFSLDEILQEPRLIAPPPRVEPGVVGIQEDIISLTLPYMPAWPELAAIYRAPTIGVTEAVAGGSNIVIVGAAGIGKTVALATWHPWLPICRSSSMPTQNKRQFLIFIMSPIYSYPWTLPEIR